MDDAKIENTGEAAARLLEAFRGHCHGEADFVNTVWSAYSVASPQGRAASAMLNTLARVYLVDFLYLIGCCHADNGRQPPSDAAKRMKKIYDEITAACERPHKWRRKAPLSHAALAACLAYADERVSLLQQTEALLEHSVKQMRRDQPFRWSRRLATERKHAEKATATLTAEYG